MNNQMILRKYLHYFYQFAPVFLVIVTTMLAYDNWGDRETTLTIWRYIRNIFYMIYIVLFPLGIYFSAQNYKNKSNKRTIDEIGMWLLSLVAITFSYAITGLFFDIAYMVLLFFGYY